MSQACNSNSKSGTFHLQTPGTALAQSLTRLFNGPLKNWRPSGVRGEHADMNDLAQRAKVRELQFKGLGTVVDMGLGAGLVGLGVGLLRHRKKVEQARKELDTIESTRGTVRFPGIKQAGVMGNMIVWLLTSPWQAMRGAYRGQQKVDLRDAGRFDTPLGMLPKGWAVPALALGVPALAVAGDRMADRITDAERQRLVDARKNKLRQQFNTLLTTPEPGVKLASSEDSCAALLNFLAPRASDMIEKGAGLEMQPSTKALGTIYTWWLLSGMLAYTAAQKFTLRRDPGAAEQKALNEFEAKQQATEPVTLRLSPGAAAGQSRISGGNPFPVAFPAFKQAWWPGASSGNAWGMDWVQDIKDKGFIGKRPGVDWNPLNPNKIKDDIYSGIASDLGMTPDAMKAQMQQGMKTLGTINEFTQGAGNIWKGIKDFGGKAWGAIQAAFPRAIDWLRGTKKSLGSTVDSFTRRLSQAPVPGASPAAVPGAPVR